MAAHWAGMSLQGVALVCRIFDDEKIGGLEQHRGRSPSAPTAPAGQPRESRSPRNGAIGLQMC